ncbi:MAG: PorP/SprF family type IX secretion system membrane protein [Bacteroidia bacterium]
MKNLYSHHFTSSAAKVIKTIHIVVLMTIFSSKNMYSQHDPEFTQYYANPIYLNPAFAGSEICPVIHINYRNQWPGLAANFTTTSVSYDQYVSKLGGGIGLYIMSDRQSVNGAFKGTYISGMYAYQLKINHVWSFRFGAEGAWSQWTLNADELTFGDQIHPQRGFIYNTNETFGGLQDNVFDFSVGGLAFSDDMYVGLTARHLTEPELVFMEGAKWPMRFNLHFGWRKPINTGGLKSKEDKSYISPNLIFSQQERFRQLNIGTYIYNDPVSIGVWYRHVFGYSDAIAVSLGIKTGQYRIGYSYDFTVSSLTNSASAGAHEISLGINLRCRKPREVIRVPVCPKF